MLGKLIRERIKLSLQDELRNKWCDTVDQYKYGDLLYIFMMNLVFMLFFSFFFFLKLLD